MLRERVPGLLVVQEPETAAARDGAPLLGVVGVLRGKMPALASVVLRAHAKDGTARTRA